MRKSKLSNTLIATWVHIVILNGFLFLICRIINLDPFLAERAITIIVAAAIYVILLLTTKQNITLKSAVLSASLFLTCAFISFTSQINFPAPTAFFLFTALIILTLSKLPPPTRLSPYAATVSLTISILILLTMYISKSPYFFQQGNRFVGFFSSPTTFSSWLCCLLTISYADTINRKKRQSGLQLFLITTSTFLIYASGTRINIIIPLIILSHQITNIGFNSRNSRRLVLLSTAALILFIYPLYEIISQYIPAEIIAFRFSGGADTSFGLRYSLFSVISDDLFSSSLREFLLGHGAEASRKLIIEHWGADLFPHNDIIRIMYDFGVAFSTIFILAIINIASRQALSTVLCMIYIISFMHNMIYSHYLIALIIITSEVVPYLRTQQPIHPIPASQPHENLQQNINNRYKLTKLNHKPNK